MVIPTGLMILAVILQGTLRNASAGSDSKQLILNLNPAEIYGPTTQPFYYGSQSFLSAYQTVNSKYQASVSEFKGQQPLPDSVITGQILSKLGPNKLQE